MVVIREPVVHDKSVNLERWFRSESPEVLPYAKSEAVYMVSDVHWRTEDERQAADEQPVRLSKIEFEKSIGVRLADLHKVLLKGDRLSSVKKGDPIEPLTCNFVEVLGETSRRRHHCFPNNVPLEVIMARLLACEKNWPALVEDMESLIGYSIGCGTIKLDKMSRRLTKKGEKHLKKLVDKYHLKCPTTSRKDMTVKRVMACFPIIVACFYQAGDEAEIEAAKPTGDVKDLPPALAFPYALCLVPRSGYQKLIDQWMEWHRSFSYVVGLRMTEQERVHFKNGALSMDMFGDSARRQILTKLGIKSDDGREFDGFDRVEKNLATFGLKVARELAELKKKQQKPETEPKKPKAKKSESVMPRHAMEPLYASSPLS